MDALGDGLRCETRRDGGGRPTSLFVPEVAPGDGTPVFMVPALGLDGRSFSRMAPLAAARPVLLWNPPNHLPRRGGAAALGDLVLDHVTRAGASGRVLLCGASLGGVAVLAAALRDPDRVAGLVLVGTSPAWKLLGPAMRVARRVHPLLPRRGYNRRLPRLLVPGRASRLGPDARALRTQMEHRTWGYADALVTVLAREGPYDLRPRLGDLPMPVLVIHCEEDRVAPWPCAAAFEAVPRMETLRLPGAAHLPLVSHPAECLEVLAPFLARAGEGAP